MDADEPMTSEQIEVDRLVVLSDRELEQELTIAASHEQRAEWFQRLLDERQRRRVARDEAQRH